MVSNAVKYLASGGVLIVLSIVVLFTFTPILNSLGIETQLDPDDCDDDGDDSYCGAWPNATGCFFILCSLFIGIVGVIMIPVAITSALTSKKEQPNNNVKMVPGEPAPNPEQMMKTQANPPTRDAKKAILWGITMIIIPLFIYSFNYNSGEALGEHCALTILMGLSLLTGLLTISTALLKSIFDE
ncbi:MAG: hypothetical protein VX320_01095 [Candidatus Thermoplasmatota archaeon]|nr:hypothetical protein [Candidatus Thermoplasmatota archaeon]